MARVTFAPIVSTASGSLAGTTFSRWHGRPYIRTKVVPFNPQSTDQTTNRDAMGRCVNLWRSLTAYLKAALDLYGVGERMSGYNVFVSRNRKDENTYAAAFLTPHNPEVSKVQDAAGAAGAAGEITATWTDPADATADKMSAWFRLVESGSEEDAIHFDSDTAIATETVTLTGLNTGEDYRVFLAPFNSTDSTYGESESFVVTAG